eukprot:TRINITY_DN2778_c4_g1_i1.p1 TRINITY_DN2778_c4_g1~~TRINITY_DN2778_c4_g1_i1.p1  ORF type:complete len:136 (+),score=28.86 TRINITY_DN2778_c4_g1_i1:58-408(+)
METISDDMMDWWMENDDLSEQLEKFVATHCEKFPDLKEDGSIPESSPELMDLYCEFKAIMEAAMEAFLKSKGVSNEDFFNVCKKKEDAGETGILTWILAATEYDTFYRSMIDEKKG